MAVDIENIIPDRMFDGGDLDCGSGLILMIRDNMLKAPARGILEMRSREPTISNDLPPWCRMSGHEFLGEIKASAVKNPTCIGRLTRREPLALGDLHFLRTLTNKPVKITLPGPYLLTRSMWVGALTRKAYRNHKKMADDIVRILREELLDLRDAGCDFVQFDEPVLTEVIMSEDCTRRPSCERRLPPAGTRERN